MKGKLGKAEYSLYGRVFELDRYGKFYIFSRDDINNQADIADCASLALHKSLIGISELSLLEESSGSLRLSKAVQTYYCVFHLFTCAMLLDSDYEIKFSPAVKGKKEVKHWEMYEVSLAALNDPSEKPEQWNRLKFLEADLASRISHGDIRSYCDSMRKARIIPNNRTEVLYKAFINDEIDNNGQCLPGLFEKMDYVRDRSVYRPTHVLCKEGVTAQTSRDVRKEIASLPNSACLYNIVLSFYKAAYDERKADPVVDSFVDGILMKENKPPIDCKDELVERLGYTWDVLEEMGGNHVCNAVPPYLAQMMELFEPKEALRFYKKYWAPILQYGAPK